MCSSSLMFALHMASRIDLPRLDENVQMDIEFYFHLFETYCKGLEIEEEHWGFIFSGLLGGIALNAWALLSKEDRVDYLKLKGAVCRSFQSLKSVMKNMKLKDVGDQKDQSRNVSYGKKSKSYNQQERVVKKTVSGQLSNEGELSKQTIVNETTIENVYMPHCPEFYGIKLLKGTKCKNLTLKLEIVVIIVVVVMHQLVIQLMISNNHVQGVRPS